MDAFPILLSVLVAIIAITNIVNVRAWKWIASACVWAFLALAFFCGLGAFFAMLASIIHFQILWAIGFFIAAVVAYGIFIKIINRLIAR